MRRLPLHKIGRRAFTLVELMIAVAIAAVVIAGLYSVFTMQSRQFLFQDLQMEMHQNQRFAADVMTRSLRMAGFGSNGRVTGYMGSGGSVDADLPAVMSFDAWDGGSDAVSVVYGDPSVRLATKYDSTPRCDTTALTFDATLADTTQQLAEFAADDMIMCMDYASMSGMETYLWVLSGAPSVTGSEGSVPVFDGTGYADFAAVCPASENLSPSLYCTKAQVMTFYVDNTDDGVGPGSPDNPVLMIDMDLNWPDSGDVPLVEGVEDVQFEYCLEDADGDGNLDDCTGAGAGWVDSVTATQGDDVQMIRISMVVRSSRGDPNDAFTSSRPALANRSGASATDNYYRQVMVTEVTVRNLRIQANL